MSIDTHSGGGSFPPDAFAVRGRLMRGPGAPAEGTVVVAGGKVVAIEGPVERSQLPRRCLEAPFIAPGFVDLQVNGGFGFDLGGGNSAGWRLDGEGAPLAALAQRLPESGVTSFLPTLISATEDHYRESLGRFRAVMQLPPAAGAARIAGVHLEGPLLAPARAGAHQLAPIEAATAALVDRLADPTLVRLVTLAPERAGALPLIAALRARGITVALGHTDASYAAFNEGVDAGATMATHLFNAMSPFHHREPGAAGAALTNDRVTVMMIVDGEHTHPAVFRLATHAKRIDSLGLVTDAIAGAGLPPGPSLLAGQPVTVDGTSARLPVDGRLAGSTLTMDRAVRNAVSFAHVSPATAVFWASEVPARAAALEGRGRLAVGDDADIVLLDEQLAVRATIVAGVLAYSNPADGETHGRALRG